MAHAPRRWPQVLARSTIIAVLAAAFAFFAPAAPSVAKTHRATKSHKVAEHARGGSRGPEAVRTHSSAMRFLTGIGDERTEMFTNPLWKQLHTTISRYIVPFDAVKHPWDMTISHRWIAAAEAAHQQILIAFYHSEYTPTRMPSLSEYTNDVKAYMKAFPKIKEYQPWNEANRGNEPHRYDSPTAVQSAQYYQVLKRLCSSCTILGLDVLDQPNVAPTMRYISEFKQELGRLKLACRASGAFTTTRTRTAFRATGHAQSSLPYLVRYGSRRPVGSSSSERTSRTRTARA